MTTPALRLTSFSFIVGGVNALGWLAAAIYYMVYVRKYLNYEGKQKTTWTTATVFTVKVTFKQYFP